MIQKVKITRVVIQDKKKDGTPYKTTSGKPFWRVGIQTEQTGDVYYSTNALPIVTGKQIGRAHV